MAPMSIFFICIIASKARLAATWDAQQRFIEHHRDFAHLDQIVLGEDLQKYSAQHLEVWCGLPHRRLCFRAAMTRYALVRMRVS